MEVASFPRLEGELEDALLCSVSSDKVILHSKSNQILIYNRQSHEIERHGCPSGRHQWFGITNGKYYECLCDATFDGVYHCCVTKEKRKEGYYDIEIQIHKLVDNSMRNVKILKYDNASQFDVFASTFYTEVNEKWITFSFEVMKEIVFNNEDSFAVFTHRDRFYALDGGKLYSLDLSNAGEQIELSDGETIEGDGMEGLFLKAHTVGDDVFIVRTIGQLWRLNMTSRKIEELPIKMPLSSQEIRKLDLTPLLSTPLVVAMEVVSFPGLEGELEDALLCSISSDKVILQSSENQILIYDRQAHEIERYDCPNGHLQRGDTNKKYYECFCHVTSDAVYHCCTTRERNELGFYDIEIQIYTLVDNSMRNVKTLKYFNASQCYICGTTFYVDMNKKCITFSFEVMKEIVFNNVHSFAVFTHNDRFYALDGGKLYSLDLSNAGEQIELSDGETIEVDEMHGCLFNCWFSKAHTVGNDVFIPRESGELWRLNMASRKMEQILQNPKVMPKCGHSLCDACEVKISVEDPIQKKKTLTCPVCREGVELKIDEYLPVNWALKDLPTLYDRGGSAKRSKHSLECSSCNEPLSEKNTFDCEFCSGRDQKIEVLICAVCVVDYHVEHITSVKRVSFADPEYKKGKTGGISRDPEEQRREKATMASTLMKVNKEFDVFFGGLEKDYERVYSRLEKLGGECLMTQKVTDKESEELMKDDSVIKKKLEKLSKWKTTFRNISQLNNDE
ncbi:hypothetical protein QR680_014846 [Steinernema hermaphroditum]|uniref:RING-type domain-containing protein n=1 Tax=Steinernema hermaphroditum TaxID=289476 RepID=A0AA39M4Z2_9BILA|nr:hypothetical protein QR680_014846 [Steinernema hermaphroditum]